MPSKVKVVRRGAEAEIGLDRWMGREVIIKKRVPKSYRHPDLDCALRASRTRNEARLMHEAREHGVPTPIIYDIDTYDASLVMQYLKGERVKDALDKGDKESVRRVCDEIGRLIAQLHGSGMTHGDLTTSNMILFQGKIWFIDFSLGSKCAGLEEMGVDIHLLKEAFSSAHSEKFEGFEIILASYAKHFPRGEEVIRKMREIEGRGRYT